MLTSSNLSYAPTYLPIYPGPTPTVRHETITIAQMAFLFLRNSSMVCTRFWLKFHWFIVDINVNFMSVLNHTKQIVLVILAFWGLNII
jgi:hypothetical protein